MDEFLRRFDAHAAAMERQIKVLNEIRIERSKQDTKWGEQNHPDGTMRYGHMELQAVLNAKRSCEVLAAAGKLTWRDILGEEIAEAYAEKDPANLRAELVQVAAVAVAWIEAIDRRTAAEGGTEPSRG